MKKQMIMLLALVFILFGCASTKDVESVNIAVAAKKTSYTDSVSRIQAKKSQKNWRKEEKIT